MNCHGWDHRAGTLGETIRSITIVDADGELKTLKPDDELFRCVVGGFGGFGVIVEVEIELAPNDFLTEWGEQLPPKEYLSYFRNKVQTDDDIAMHLYRPFFRP